MDSRIELLRKQSEQMFSKRATLMSLWQSLADNFYPERADFTTTRVLGTEFGTGLMTSYPLMARRDLGNTFSSVLRPSGKQWFEQTVQYDEENIDNEARKWLEMATEIQRRAMYDRASNFVRATKEGDHDFATFGQCVISVEMNADATALLYRCWHLRDVAWAENAEGKIDQVMRKWKCTARDLMKIFPQTCPDRVKTAYDKDPFCEFNVMHAVVPASQYELAKKHKMPFVSVYYMDDNGEMLQEVPSATSIYVIPRWQTVSGSQYAYSPATVIALPDARLIQAMTAVILEAGEKAVNPPMIAAQQAIRSDIAIYQGGITWVDAEYDERLGEALRPLPMDRTGIPLGIELSDRTMNLIKEAFYLNKITLPPPQQGMTAYEVNQRVTEYIRQAMPLFEPMEVDYNGALCENTFDLLFRYGAFGPIQNIPKSLSGTEIRFKFKSPLADAMEAEKGQILQQAKMLIAQTADLDPNTSRNILNAKVALRDALNGINVPAKWLNDEDMVEAMNAQDAQQAQQAQLLDQISKGGQIAKDFGQANQAFTEAQPA